LPCGAGLLAALAAGLAIAQPYPVFVLNSLDATVSVIDPVTWKETKAHSHRQGAAPPVPDAGREVGDHCQCAGRFADLHRPATAEVQRTVRGILDPYQLRFSPDMKWFVTAANRLNHVDIYRWDGKDMTLAKRISTGKTPSHLWIDSKSTTVWATMQDSDELVAIDLPRRPEVARQDRADAGGRVWHAGRQVHVLVGLTGGDGVEVYDVSGKEAQGRSRPSRPARARIPFAPQGDGRHVLVSNRVANTISKIDYRP
jgi:DNA-binding beta-propeller fold protein YncE